MRGRGGETSQNYITLRVQVPNNHILGTWVLGTSISTIGLGKYMIIRYLDP